MTQPKLAARERPIAPPSDPTVGPPTEVLRVGPLSPLLDLLREDGRDPAAMLEFCALPTTLFDDSGALISFDAAARLLRESAVALGRADIGLLIGQRFDFASFGLLATLMQCAPTVGAALDNLQLYYHLHDRGGVPYLRPLDDGEVALGFSLFRHSFPGLWMAHDLSMSLSCKMLRALCGAGWKPKKVMMSHPAPVHTDPYRDCFAAPVLFEASHTEIQFDAAWLAQPIAGADAAMMAAARLAADAYTERDAPSTALRTRAAAQALVMTGALSGARIALVLEMHERTLRRHLRAEGTSLHAIVAEARFEVARQLLRDTQLALPDVAQALKYSDTAAFSRAFRAWAERSPGRWRAAARRAATDAG